MVFPGGRAVILEPFWRAGVAQLVEHLICNQRVGGSNPFASSRLSCFEQDTGRGYLPQQTP